MKTKVAILVNFLLISIGYQTYAQDNREVTAYSSCNGSGLKSATSDYNLGYSYRETDSTLIISGYLGHENCGIEHIFTAKIDSNKVELSEVIIDTLLATCTCSKTIKIEIDSFFYDQFTVEFDGDFLQIAVLLILSTLYQSITNSKIYRGNDLVTVLLTEVCDHLLVR